MYKHFIGKLESICKSNSSYKIFRDINNLYKIYTPAALGKSINDEIVRNFDISKLNIIKNGDSSYYKYNLIKTDNFDVFDIKWEKDSFSKIHNHPEKGCVVYLYNKGILTESNYIISNDKLQFISNKYITHGDIGYKISDKYLHKIKCNSYSETVHIYIPGNFKMKYYIL